MKNFLRSTGARVGVVGVAVMGFAGAASAQATDPSTALVATLGTYLVDVGLLAVAILAIYYGKKLVSYLKV